MNNPTEPINEEQRAEWLAWFRNQRRDRDDCRFAALIEDLSDFARAPLDPKCRKAQLTRRRNRIDSDVHQLQELWTSRYDNEAMDGTRLARFRC